MVATVNASTSAGVVITPDNSGVLAFQSSSATALTIDASQNVTLVGTLTTTGITNSGVATATRFNPTGSSATGNGMYLPAANSLGLSTNGTNAVYIDSSQNVGIGTTSPSTYGKLVSYAGDIATVKAHGSGSYPTIILQNATAGTTFSGRLLWKDGNGNAGWNVGQNVAVGSGYLEFNDGATNRMCIDSSGYVGIGVTNPNLYAGLVCRKAVSGTWNGISSNASFTVSDAIGSTFVIHHSSANSYTNFLGTDAGGRLQMYCSGTGAGGVYLGNGGTSWTSASDERVKDIIEPITNGLTKVSTLRAVIGKYKTDEEGIRRSFLIAQDVEAVLPEAINYSNPDELGLSYTDVIPLLVASIKELKAINDTLTARIVALENR